MINHRVDIESRALWAIAGILLVDPGSEGNA